MLRGFFTAIITIFLGFIGWGSYQSFLHEENSLGTFLGIACAVGIIPLIIYCIKGQKEYAVYLEKLNKFGLIKELRTKFYKLLNSLEVRNKEISSEIKNHASDLKQCSTYINDLIEEKKFLESEYLDPYLT